MEPGAPWSYGPRKERVLVLRSPTMNDVPELHAEHGNACCCDIFL